MTARLLPVGIGAALLLLAGSVLSPLAAQGEVPLAGEVRSAEEGGMEGVLVSAKQDGTSITITVVSGAQGRYTFPAGRLEPGHYAISVRADGYALAGMPSVDVAAAKSAALDLELKKTEDLAPQLSDAEWLASIPGTEAQKSFLTNCIDCHTLQRILSSTHNSDEFVQVFQRMSGYALGSSPLKPQLMVGGPQNPVPVGNPRVKTTADYLASVNLQGKQHWDYKLQPAPRAKGKATRVVITEYDLPRPDAKPHDVIVDRDGTVWYSDFGAQSLGALDPKTGTVTEHPVPELRKDFPKGAFGLEQDGDGNLWLALLYQGGVARYDRQAKSFKTFPFPAAWLSNYTRSFMVVPTGSNVVWADNQDTHALYRLDAATGTYEDLGALKLPGSNRPIAAYGMPADRDGNLYLLNFAGAEVVKLDAKTKQLSTFTTPTANSRPRRGRFDEQGRLWFAEFAANSIAMLDPKTEKIQEWKLPTAWSTPADVAPDKKGGAWAAAMLGDRIARLEPSSGEIIEYPLPRHSSIWRIFVDESQGAPQIWAGSDHGASIVKLEPLD
jgi:virginiamycin B lyase